MSRREIEDAFMMAPASMNSGIASSGKLDAPSNITSARFGSIVGPWMTMTAISATSPSATAMGTLSIASAIMPTSIRVMVIGRYPAHRARHATSPRSVRHRQSLVRARHAGPAAAAWPPRSRTKPRRLELRMVDAQRHPRQTDHAVAAEHLQHLEAGPRQHDEKEEDASLGENRQCNAPWRHGVDEARHADVRALSAASAEP